MYVPTWNVDRESVIKKYFFDFFPLRKINDILDCMIHIGIKNWFIKNYIAFN